MVKRFSREQVHTAIIEGGAIPLFTHEDRDIAAQVIDASYAGGIRVFEFTNRKSNSFETFAYLINYVQKYPDFILGIGTVLDESTTQRFIDAGAQFIVSPIVKPSMGKICADHGIPWIPGCATFTELITAREHGALMMKVFPGTVLGPEFVSSVLAVVPDLQLLVSGGVEPTNESLAAWFNAGATCVGLGSQLFTKDIVTTGNWVKLRQNVGQCLSIIQRLKK